MSYAEKVVGAVCASCHQGKYVRNPKTGKTFCDKKCWLNGTQTPVQPQTAPQVANNAFESGSIDDLYVKIGEINQTLANMRKWATLTDREIVGLKTLSVDLRGEKAVELHMPEKKYQFDLNKVKEQLNPKVEIQFPPDL